MPGRAPLGHSLITREIYELRAMTGRFQRSIFSILDCKSENHGPGSGRVMLADGRALYRTIVGVGGSLTKLFWRRDVGEESSQPPQLAPQLAPLLRTLGPAMN